MNKSTDNADTSTSDPPIFSKWINTATILSKSIQTAKDMYQAVYDIDTEMVNLAKVSNATSSQLNNALETATEAAKKCGASIGDIIHTTADWNSRGYDLTDSEKLAKASAIYKNISGSMDMKTANQSLLSTLQGYQLNADNALSVIDKFSKMANDFPVNTADIGEALQHSAASFYDANTSLSKSIALITGSSSISQDPDSIGTMWETVSMRIRGADEELKQAGLDAEGMLESTSQLRDFIHGMTGFDIVSDNDTLKDVYDIVVGIGEKWGELSNTEQTSLLEKLAGSQAGALNAALNNVDKIKEAYASVENSDGFALTAQEASLDSISGKTQQFEAAFQSLSGTVMDSDLLKFFIDFGTSVISTADSIIGKFGSIELAIGALGSYTLSKNGLD